jgi:hypothetical protein
LRKDEVQAKAEMSFPAKIEAREREDVNQFVSTYKIEFNIEV